MDNRTEFRIEKGIEIWKAGLIQNSNMTQDNVEELESHLLDEIHELQEIGLSLEESFLIAKKRIGKTKELANEFGKVNKGVNLRNRILPYLKGILCFLAFMSTTDLLTNALVLLGDKFGFNSYLNWISIALLIVFSLIPFAIIVRKYKTHDFPINHLMSIPFLVITVMITKSLTYLTLIYMSRHIQVEIFGSLRMNFSVFGLVFSLLILILSSFIYYISKRDNKIIVAE